VLSEDWRSSMRSALLDAPSLGFADALPLARASAIAAAKPVSSADVAWLVDFDPAAP